MDYGPFLKLFEKDPEKLSVITVSQFIKSFSASPDYVPAFSLVSGIGEAIEQEFRIMQLDHKTLSRV